MDFSIIAISNEILGTAGTEFINFPIAVPNSIRWSVFVDGIKSRVTTLVNIVSLTKLVRIDSQPVADATTVTVRGIDTGFDITTITPVALFGSWGSSFTKFNLQGYSTMVRIDSVAGEYLSAALQNLSFFKYPSTPAISAQIAGNAFNGNSMIRAVVTVADNSTCTVRLASENTSNTFATTTTYRVLVNVSFDGLRIT
ncbi:hypothetical protein [Serratia fonticola]|uniref:hypothetical protein n=1 Tax=Serratia fonticola TaxID=47917 RepID=UPI003BB7DCFE